MDMTSRLVERLRTEVDGDVLADPGTRAMYAADASNYRHVPLVVVRPRTVDAAVAAVGVAAELGVPITSRGAGTSIAGNACGEGLVLGLLPSPEPGARRGSRRADGRGAAGRRAGCAERHGGAARPALRPRSVDAQSLHDRRDDRQQRLRGALGGVGKTVDNVESLDVLLPDGSRFEAGPVADDVLPLHGRLRALRDEVMAAVRTGFPRIPRRVSGYNLDQLLPENGFHVGRALVGSEGTCVTVLGATVKLVEIPRFRALVVLGFEDTYAAADQVVALLSLDVLAIEGVNEDIVSILRQRKPGTPGLKALPAGRSWLFVETVDPDAVVAAMPGATGSVVVTDPARMRELWRIREDGPGWRPGCRTAPRRGRGGRTPRCRRGVSGRTCGTSIGCSVGTAVVGRRMGTTATAACTCVSTSTCTGRGIGRSWRRRRTWSCRTAARCPASTATGRRGRSCCRACTPPRSWPRSGDSRRSSTRAG
ncbi:hypothetical protein GCM10018954_035780 [Kutzneria kofuensis]